MINKDSLKKKRLIKYLQSYSNASIERKKNGLQNYFERGVATGVIFSMHHSGYISASQMEYLKSKVANCKEIDFERLKSYIEPDNDRHITRKAVVKAFVDFPDFSNATVH